MKLIVGLGNPGIEYQFTPHNMGFLAIDRLAERCGVRVDNRHCRAATARARVADVPVLLAKPETYMNLSGISVAALVEEYGAEPQKDLIVIYDDLDLPFGSVRIRERGSAGSHKGMISVIGELETQELLRIRLGIAPEHAITSGKDYVLSPWRSKLDPVVDEMLDAAADAVEIILREGPGAAMTRFNRKVPPPDEAEQPRKEE
ncbi:MAG: aminoacyl-tRNA hydrolase [Candidatus Korobacteraceae bacterium]